MYCVAVLDTPCKELQLCGNSSHPMYKEAYYFTATDYFVASKKAYLSRGYYCNVENICNCGPGYKRYGLTCVPSMSDMMIQTFCLNV